MFAQNEERPPIWFMRQAGRYHSHYQNLKKSHSFIELCKIPELAAEVALGPVEDFGFDAAILFSDLLFPLEAMGMGLAYEPGPKLSFLIKTPGDCNKLSGDTSVCEKLVFQKEALKILKEKLSLDKGIIGFVGAPLTLFTYAVEGSHLGKLSSTKQGLFDGRYEIFCEKLIPILAENMYLQAEGGADVIVLFDTAAGEFSLLELKNFALPMLKKLLEIFHGKKPNFPVIYYSKGTNIFYFELLQQLSIVGIGLDWRTPMEEVLKKWGSQMACQGNFDPELLFLPKEILAKKIREYFKPILDLPKEKRKGYICGLGHGVLPETPEENVRLFVQIAKEVFI